MDCKKKLQTQYIGEVPIDTLESLPDFMLAERDVTDPTTQQVIRSMVRVPGARLFGGGTLDNVTTIEPNNTITVPENQVIAARVENNGSYNTVVPTTAASSPDFLIVGKLGDLLLIQNSGFVVIPNGHSYIVGQTYYSGENGVPTTNSASGHRLFKPISSTKLAINLD